MSQQINLLAHEQKPLGSALAALVVLAMVLIGLLVYGVTLRNQTMRLQHDADSGQRQIAQANAALHAMRERAGNDNDAVALKAEIDALKLKMESVKPWLEPISSGSLGSPDGYARQLSMLAGVPEEGLWITSVSVGNAGKLVSLGGRALRNESVLRYAKRLNEVFAPQGVQFNSVEMTPDSLVRAGEPGKPVLSAVVFRLF